MSTKYVVRGGLVRCNCGSTPTRLNLPNSHGVYVNDKAVLIDTDTAPGANVVPFGHCRKLRGPCRPAPAPTWSRTKTDTLINDCPALITTSTLSCGVGGVITIENDGQQG